MFLAQWWFAFPVVGIPLLLIVLALLMEGIKKISRTRLGDP